MEKTTKMYRFMLWRGIATMFVVGILLIGALIYVGFYANGYSVAQKVIVVLIALIIGALAVSTLWMLWMKEGMKRFKKEIFLKKAWQ